MEIKIVKTKIEDYNNFLTVFKEIEELHRKNVSRNFIKPKWELFSKDYFKELINDKESLFLLAKDWTNVVGYTISSKEKSSDNPILKPRKRIDISDLSVKQEYKKNGIGTLFMEQIEIWAKKNRISEVELSVWSFNEWAIQFYEKKWYKTFRQKMRKSL